MKCRFPYFLAMTLFLALTGCKMSRSTSSSAVKSDVLDPTSADSPVGHFVIDRCAEQGQQTAKTYKGVGKVFKGFKGNLKVQFGGETADNQPCYFRVGKSDAELGLQTDLTSGSRVKSLCGNTAGQSGTITWVAADMVRVFYGWQGQWEDRQCLNTISNATIVNDQPITQGEQLIVICDSIETQSKVGATINALDLVKLEQVIQSPSGSNIYQIVNGSLRGQADPACFELRLASVKLGSGLVIQSGAPTNKVSVKSDCTMTGATPKIGYIVALSKTWALTRASAPSSVTTPVAVECLVGN